MAKAKKEHLEKVFLSDDDMYLFGQGTHYDIYKKLGAHLSEEDFEIQMAIANKSSQK